MTPHVIEAFQSVASALWSMVGIAMCQLCGFSGILIGNLVFFVIFSEFCISPKQRGLRVPEFFAPARQPFL